MIRNTSPDKSGNPENLKKIATVNAHSWGGFADGVPQVVLFTVL